MSNYSNKIINAFQNFLKINLRVFPYVSILAIFLGLIESYKYSGFIKKHTLVDFNLILNFMILSGYLVIVWSIIKNRNVPDKFYRKLYTFNSFFLPFFLIFTYCIDNIASQRGPNYIFSILHIQSDNLLYVLIASLMILFVRLVSSLKI